MSLIPDAVKESSRWKELHVDVRPDGYCDDTQMETLMQLPLPVLIPSQHGYEIDHKNRFVAFQVDASGYYIEVRLPFESVEMMAKELAVVHGISCKKQPHDNPDGGYLHEESDDSSYDVDGCIYCGRCHVAIP